MPVDVSRFRSMLFVPGDSERKLAKAASVPADALIVDWEDAVSDQDKEKAPIMTKSAMPGLKRAEPFVLIRVNSTTPDRFREDCRAARDCDPDGIVIPGCESVRTVETLLRMYPGDGVVIPLIESPLGVVRAADIAFSSDRVAALIFGAEDYSAEVGVMRTEGEPELAFARSAVVNAARAAGREVFDSPLMRFDDPEAIRRAAWRGRRIGFTGQLAIHPGQLPVINDVYSSSRDAIQEAERVLERYQEHGGGVYAVDGSLEDKPAAKNALRILARRR